MINYTRHTPCHIALICAIAFTIVPVWAQQHSAGEDFILRTGSSVGTLVERVRVKQSGLIGVGTQSPTTDVDISGTAKVTGLIIDAGTAATPGLRFNNDTDTGIYNYAADTIGFSTAGTEAARITSASSLIIQGNVSVPNGTAAAPSIRFSNDTDTGMYLYTSDSLGFATGGVEAARITANNGFVIQGSFSAPNLVTGRGDNTLCWVSSGTFRQTANAAGCTNTSDARLKTDVTTIGDSLEKLMKLRPVTFHWKPKAIKDLHKETTLQMGFIAQEVDKVLPEITVKPTKDNEYWGMYNNALIPYMVQGMQQLKAENDELRTRLDALERRLPPQK